MSDKLLFKESVRGIIEYVLKNGSLDDRFVSRGRAVEGTIAHSILQKDNETIYEDYEKEDRKSTRLNSSHVKRSRMPSSA